MVIRTLDVKKNRLIEYLFWGISPVVSYFSYPQNLHSTESTRGLIVQFSPINGLVRFPSIRRGEIDAFQSEWVKVDHPSYRGIFLFSWVNRIWVGGDIFFQEGKKNFYFEILRALFGRYSV